MKLNIIKRALEQLLTTDLNEQEIHDTLIALQEVHTTLERATDNDVYDDQAYIISASSIFDIMINDLYNVYAKRRKSHGDDFPVSYFQHDARKEFGFEDFTNEQLQIGYDIISDLWRDNEAQGNHDENGFFITTDIPKQPTKAAVSTHSLPDIDDVIQLIKRDNDTEMLKLVELYEYITRPDIQETMGTGEYDFVLGFGDKIIKFFDKAQTYNDFYDLLVNSITDY